VASRKRGAAVRTMLTEAGVPGVDTIRNPAGLDLGARSAPEVALSILAEIVQMSPAEASGFCGTAAGEVRLKPDTTPDEVRLKPETTNDGSRPTPDSGASGVSRTDPSGVAIDPVCHMEVEIAGARLTAEFGGATYYFCCAQCRHTFMKDPAASLAPRT
jgi:xanthine dehydrogenase accessory factor